jgi:xylose dehydrogenase (NAD/NADP)
VTDRLRWGVLSTARIGTNRFIPGVQSSRNGVVAAIASRDLARAQQAATRLGIPRAYGSYEELLADPAVDAIYNPLPNSMHAAWTLACAQAGKPILCEKPLAATAAEAAAMVEGCRNLGVPLMEAFMYRFHPQHMRVRTLLDQGAIGALRSVRAAFTFQMEPLDPNNVRLKADLAGGAVMDVGCYAINACRMLFQEEPVWASAQFDRRDEFGVEVMAACILGFSDRRMAIFDAGFRAAGNGWYMAAGATGQIEVFTAFTPVGDTTIRITTPEAVREEHFAAVNQYQLEAEEFADALQHGRPFRVPAEDGVATMRVIDALRQSAATAGVRVVVQGD